MATMFERNARFFGWFPPTDSDDDTLVERMPDLKHERARSRLAEGRSHRHETEVKDGPRSVSLTVELRSVVLDGAQALLVECHDVSKQKEAEYMLGLARIGLHTGPVIGSMVGVQKYVYDIFGPGVNLAARMETLAAPMAITVSEAIHAEICDDFTLTDLGEVEVKGFGTQRIYSLDSEGRR